MKTETRRLLAIGAAAATAGYLIHSKASTRAGYYWAFVSQRPSDQPAIREFFRKNKDAIIIRKTVSPQQSPLDDPLGLFPADKPASWILFEAKGPYDWTLPGKPSPAPKGMDTLPKDIVGDEEVSPALTSPEHPWNKFWGTFWSDGSDGKAPNPILSLWNALGKAGPIIVYGGVAIVLVQLWSALSTVQPSRSRKRLGA